MAVTDTPHGDHSGKSPEKCQQVDWAAMGMSWEASELSSRCFVVDLVGW